MLSEAQFDASLWARYLAHAEELVVVAREGTMPSGRTPEQLPVSSREKVSFVLLPNIASIKGIVKNRGAARRRIAEVVETLDGVVARLPSEIGLIAVDCAERAGKPLAVEVVGCPWDGLWNYGSLAGKIYAPIMWARTRGGVKRAPFAHYVTQEFLQRRYPHQAERVAAASDVELTKPDPAVLEARLARIARDTDEPLNIGLIGTLRGRFKGIQVALQAFAQIREQMPPFRFLVLGGGDKVPWEAMAKEVGVADVVDFVGTIPGGEPVMRWLDTTDIYIQPSLKEGLPRALVEAMSRGCPAIGSRCAGIPELLEPEWIVRRGNVDDLAKALLKMAGSREVRAEQAKRNFKEAEGYAEDQLGPIRSAYLAEFAQRCREARP